MNRQADATRNVEYTETYGTFKQPWEVTPKLPPADFVSETGWGPWILLTVEDVDVASVDAWPRTFRFRWRRTKI